MKIWRTIAMVGFVLAMIAADTTNASAATYGSSSEYKLIGFSADSKYVYFERHDSDIEEDSIWLRVVDVKTSKQVKAVRIEHDSGEDTYVSKKQGQKIRASLYGQYGKPNAATLPGDNALEATWKAGDYAVDTKLTQIGKLPDFMEEFGGTANFTLSVHVSGKGEWKSEKKVYAPTIDNDFNGNIQEWPELYLQQLALSPDGAAIAVVFGRKPFVVRRESAEDIAKAKVREERRAKRKARRQKRSKKQ